MGHPIEKIERFFATSAEYLEHEAKAIHKHELIRGEVVAMAGGSFNHNAVSSNVFGSLFGKLRGSSCRVFNSDMKVAIRSKQSVYYPDISVACGRLDIQSKEKGIIRNPRLIIEVLSPSTAEFDRTTKFDDYQSLPSLQEYALIDPNRARVDVFRKQESGIWAIFSTTSLEEIVRFESVDVELEMKEIYEHIEFENEKPKDE